MTHEHAHAKKQFDAADYPALREFFPAYLHQDFAEEYDTAEEAVKGFLSEASGDEILQVQEEWKLFLAVMHGRPFPEVKAALHELGSAWSPENEQEWKSVEGLLMDARG